MSRAMVLQIRIEWTLSMMPQSLGHLQLKTLCNCGSYKRGPYILENSQMAFLVDHNLHMIVFHCRCSKGSEASLKGVHSILICKTMARDMTADNAIGKIIKFDNLDNLMVAGVFEDFPSNSQFAEIKMLLPMNYYFTISESTRKLMNNWEVYDFNAMCCSMRKRPSFRLHRN